MHMVMDSVIFAQSSRKPRLPILVASLIALLAAHPCEALLHRAERQRDVQSAVDAESPVALIRTVLEVHRNRTLAAASSALVLRHQAEAMLGQLKLNISMAASPAALDQATETLNNMIASTRWELEQKIAVCHTYPEALESAARSAMVDTHDLAAEVSHLRTKVLQEADELPEDTEWFSTLRTEVAYGRRECDEERREQQVRAEALREERRRIATIRSLLIKRCPGNSFLESGSIDTDRSVQNSSASLLQLTDTALRRFLLHKNSSDLLRQSSMDKGGSLIVRHSAVGPTELCTRAHDTLGQLVGEVADNEASLKADVATSARDCKQDREFERKQMMAVARHKGALSSSMADASSKLGSLQERVRHRDRERGQLNDKAYALKNKCKSDIDALLHGRLCDLQRVRDQMWLLAGRTALPVDCELSEWVHGPCSVTCGGGIQESTRTAVLPAWNGAACPPLKMQQSCGQEACPADCQVSTWTGWTACSAACDGGFQERTRTVVKRPQNEGDACRHLVDMRACNSRACDRDCMLGDWTKWSTCSQACNEGNQRSYRNIIRNPVGAGACPDEDSDKRLSRKPCNKYPCPAAATAKCMEAPTDAMLLADSSGSLGQVGFGYVKALTLELVRRYALGSSGAHLSVATFSTQAKLVSGLVGDAGQLQKKVQTEFAWTKNVSLLSQAITLASRVMQDARTNVAPVAMVLTDGHFADPFLGGQVAAKLRAQGIRLMFVLVGGGERDRLLARHFASAPVEENIIEVPSMDHLGQHISEVAGSILFRTCSELSAP